MCPRKIHFTQIPPLVCYKNTAFVCTWAVKVAYFYFLGYGRKEVVDILLMAGANVHARDDGGLIPLHNACSFGHAEVQLFCFCLFFCSYIIRVALYIVFFVFGSWRYMWGVGLLYLFGNELKPNFFFWRFFKSLLA